jgi:hypothetical protein
VLATDRARIGQTVTLELYAYSTVEANAPGTSTRVTFDVLVTDPCPFTIINALATSLYTMNYVIAASAAIQNFVALDNSKAVLT